MRLRRRGWILLLGPLTLLPGVWLIVLLAGSSGLSRLQRQILTQDNDLVEWRYTFGGFALAGEFPVRPEFPAMQ